MVQIGKRICMSIILALDLPTFLLYTCNGLCTSYRNNPIYELSLNDGSDDNDVLVELKGPKQFSIGFDIKQCSSVRNKPFERRHSGAFRFEFPLYIFSFLFSYTILKCIYFRPGYTALAVEAVPAGIYNIQPMTFDKGQEGPFFLTVEASCFFTVKRIQ